MLKYLEMEKVICEEVIERLSFLMKKCKEIGVVKVVVVDVFLREVVLG